MRRVVIISKCEECPKRDECKLRTMCGCIPDECGLPTVEREYRREHETRGYGVKSRLKPAERPAEASATVGGATASAGTGKEFELLRYGGGE